MMPLSSAVKEKDPLAADFQAPRDAVFQVMPGVQRFVLSGAAIALGILGLYAGQVLLIPLALAALLAFILDPLVSWLRRWSMPRALAVSLVLAVALSVLLYYSAQVFLLGAEFTWVYANARGSRRALPH